MNVDDILSHVLAPGQKTTEFLGAVVVTLVHAVVAALAVWHPGFALSPHAESVVLSEVGLAVSVVWAFYTKARKDVKVAAINNLVTGTEGVLKEVGAPPVVQHLVSDVGTDAVATLIGTYTAPVTLIPPTVSTPPTPPVGPLSGTPTVGPLSGTPTVGPLSGSTVTQVAPSVVEPPVEAQVAP